MPKTDLLVRLRDLHEELSSINFDVGGEGEVDEETIDALGELTTDIGRLIDQARQGEQEIQDNEHHDILERIQEFDVNHPRVSSFLSQITDLLAMMGI
ncbi:MAG: DUF4404 family protein [Planctomycetota bacterium]